MRVRPVAGGLVGLLLLAAGAKAASSEARGLLARARAGDVVALHDLGLRLLRGQGVTQRVDRGLDFLERASFKDHAPSSVALGKIHGRGLFGVRVDPRRAHLYLSRAARQGDAAAAAWVRRNPAPPPEPVGDRPVQAARGGAPEVLVIDGDAIRAEEGPFHGEPPPPPPALSPERVRELTSGSLPVLIVFDNPRCGPCRMYEPILHAEVDGRSDLELRVVDTSEDEGLALLFALGAQGTPTSVLFDPAGAELGREVGALPAGQLRAFLDRHL